MTPQTKVVIGTILKVSGQQSCKECETAAHLFKMSCTTESSWNIYYNSAFTLSHINNKNVISFTICNTLYVFNQIISQSKADSGNESTVNLILLWLINIPLEL